MTERPDPPTTDKDVKSIALHHAKSKLKKEITSARPVVPWCWVTIQHLFVPQARPLQGEVKNSQTTVCFQSTPKSPHNYHFTAKYQTDSPLTIELTTPFSPCSPKFLGGLLVDAVILRESSHIVQWYKSLKTKNYLYSPCVRSLAGFCPPIPFSYGLEFSLPTTSMYYLSSLLLSPRCRYHPHTYGRWEKPTYGVKG